MLNRFDPSQPSGGEAEVRYLIGHEWAVKAHDVLWRRTKDGPRLSKEQAEALEEYMAAIPARMAG